MKKNIDSKIRLNVILLYFLIFVACVSFVSFFYSLAEQLNTKRMSYDEYYNDIALIHQMTDEVNQIQAEANLFIYTHDSTYLRRFDSKLNSVMLKVDSLHENKSNVPGSVWREIGSLLRTKEHSMKVLSKQLTMQNDVILLKDKELEKIIKNQIEAVKDTIVQKSEKGRFWDRLANVFNPNEKEDTIFVVKQLGTNIIEQRTTDLAQVNESLLKMQNSYNERIVSIGSQIKQLVIADQEISSNISDLLIKLNNQIVYSRWDELEKEEVLLYENNRKILILGIVTLVFMLVFIVLIVSDINKSQALRKALEKAYERNKEIMESRHKLLLSVSHDIKTPLNSILGYMELSQRKETLGPKEITSMRTSGKHILSLLNNLLEYSSLEQERLKLSSSDFVLDELYDEIEEMFAPLTKAKNLNFVKEKDFDPQQVLHSDHLRIKQILTNLLSNAVKYTKEGAILFRISYQKGLLSVVVKDTGAGIDEDSLADIYKPFTRVDSNNSLAEGSGFGMYVVKGLVRLFDGKIQCQSEVGKGTTFTIHLSVGEGKAKPEDIASKYVLIVDDDKVLLSVLSKMAVQLGHRVAICGTKKEFEEKLPGLKTYDAILTDMEMTDFTGQDILARIRNLGLQTPVYLMTGRMDYHTQLAQSEGFADCMSKPITLRRLYLLIGGAFSKDHNEDFVGESMLGDVTDKAVVQIVEEFLFSAVNNLVELREAVDGDDFKKAQFICHKMRPMCVQLEADAELISVMEEIDSFRNKPLPADYRWKDKILTMLDGLEEFLGKVQKKYLTDETD